MRLILLGNGGLADEVQDLAEGLGHVVIARLTTDHLDLLTSLDFDQVIFAVGSPKTKRIFWEAMPIELKCRLEWATLISPYARVGSRTSVCPGSVIQHGVVITNGVMIAPHVYLNINCTVGHGATINTFSTVNPGANISGDVELGSYVLVGTGAQVLEKTKVGKWSIIGAGAVVTKDVPEFVIAKGVPAKW